MAEWLDLVRTVADIPPGVPAEVMVQHEQYGGACRCGAALGDSIDWTWHIANVAYRAGLVAAQKPVA